MGAKVDKGRATEGTCLQSPSYELPIECLPFQRMESYCSKRFTKWEMELGFDLLHRSETWPRNTLADFTSASSLTQRNSLPSASSLRPNVTSPYQTAIDASEKKIEPEHEAHGATTFRRPSRPRTHCRVSHIRTRPASYDSNQSQDSKTMAASLKEPFMGKEGALRFFSDAIFLACMEHGLGLFAKMCYKDTPISQ